MRLTERQIRKIVREMALKSYNIIPSDETLGGETFDLGYEEGAEVDAQYVPEPDPDVRARSGAYIGRTYGQKGYRRTVERQMERTPFPLNVFILPSVDMFYSEAGLGGVDRSPDPARLGPDSQAKMLSFLERIAPEAAAQISPGDVTLIIQPAGLGERDESFNELTPEDIGSHPNIKTWRQGDGVYMAFHAMFDNGGLGMYNVPFNDPFGRISELIMEYVIAGDYERESEILAQILRIKTLRDAARTGGGHDTLDELATVAVLRDAIPVNLGSFPTEDVEGNPIPQEVVAEGNDAIQELYDAVVSVKENVYAAIAGKIIPVRVSV